MTSGRRLAFLPALVCALLLLGVAAPPAAAVAAPQVRAPRWLAPVPRPVHVVRGFDPPAHPWLAGHRGVDLAAAVGSPVRAAGRGVVSVAGSVAGTLVVAVRHADGLETTYEPVRPVVHRGQLVSAGDILGVLVMAGGHCHPAACLHWGLRRGADYLDPLGLLGRARVRLLPLGARPPQWTAPLAGGVATGSVLTWAAVTTRAARRRRRPPPRGVPSLAAARARQSDRLRPDDDEVGVPGQRGGEDRNGQPQQRRGRPP